MKQLEEKTKYLQVPAFYKAPTQFRWIILFLMGIKKSLIIGINVKNKVTPAIRTRT